VNKKTDYHGPSGNHGVNWDELFQIWLALDARIGELYRRAAVPTFLVVVGEEDGRVSSVAKMNAWDADCYQTCCELWFDMENILAVRSMELDFVQEVENYAGSL